MHSLKKFIKFWTPYGIMTRNLRATGAGFTGGQRGGSESYDAKKCRRYFLELNPCEQEQEVRNIIEYFRKEDNPTTMYSSDFTKKYRIDYDKHCNMSYVFYENKKLYFPCGWLAPDISRYYDELLMEQDEESPHRYETPDFCCKKGDIIADVGAAEGIWALKYVDICKKIYLFECNSMWITALEKTFEPWKDKVVIVNKYVSNVNDERNTTLDEFFQKRHIDFIKADIEGAEVKLVEGGKEILSKDKNIKVILCTYHNKNDAEELKFMLEKLCFETEYSKGYMIVWWQKNSLPYYRRGVIRAKKMACNG